jgi:hypothetical protein
LLLFFWWLEPSWVRRFFFAGAAFFAVNFLATGFLILVGLAFAFLALEAAGFLAAVFAFSLATFFFSAPSFFEAAGNLNDPEAPLPLVWMSFQSATAFFKNFLMNGANFSQSTL